MCGVLLMIGAGLGSGCLSNLLLRSCHDVTLLLHCFRLLRLRHALSSRRLLRLVSSPHHGGTRSGLPALSCCRKLRLPLLVLSRCPLRILLCSLGLRDLAVGKCLSSSSYYLLARGGHCGLCLVLASRLLRSTRLLHSLRSLSLGSNGRLLLLLGSRHGQRRLPRVHGRLCLCRLLIDLRRLHFLGGQCCLSLRPAHLACGVGVGGGCRGLLAPCSHCCRPRLGSILGLFCLRRLLRSASVLLIAIRQGLGSGGLGYLLLRNCHDVRLLLSPLGL